MVLITLQKIFPIKYPIKKGEMSLKQIFMRNFMNVIIFRKVFEWELEFEKNFSRTERSGH